MFKLVCTFTDGSSHESLHGTQIAAIRRANSVIGKLRTSAHFATMKNPKTVDTASVIDTTGLEVTQMRRGLRGDPWLPFKPGKKHVPEF